LPGEIPHNPQEPALADRVHAASESLFSDCPLEASIIRRA
jgi:hypothetical protein